LEIREKMRIFLIFVLLLAGCANKKLADIYYKTHNYDKAYQDYYEFAKRGFPDAAYKLAKLIYLDKVKRPPFIERKYALLAYTHGFKDAALFVADSYYREKEFKKAFEWYNKVDFSLFNSKDFRNYINVLLSLNSFKTQQKYLKKLQEFALKSQNPKLLAILGEFYLSDTPFYNPKKAIKFLKMAYNRGNYKAGVVLGVFYIKSNTDPKKGYEILKKVAYIDAKAAYYLGDYLYDKMIKQERIMNYNCITSEFNSSKEFFYKKLKIYKFNDLFSRINVVKAYRLSYRLGNKSAIYKLISLDIEDNTFELSKSTYSGFDLKEAVKFLNSQNDIRSKLLLAKIYEKYLYLNGLKKAKEIYLWYVKIDKIQAYWHLYQYEKRFEKKLNFKYLDFLVKNDFTPAIIEKAYQEILLGKDIEKNRLTLEYYAKQGNILALNYLGSLYSRSVFLPKEKSFFYYKKACVLEKKPFYIPSEDLKFGNFYEDVDKNQTKAYSIFYYYAQMKNRPAQYIISQFYKNSCNYKKLKYWVEELVRENDFRGVKFYYSLILQRFLEGDYKKALKYLKKQDDVYSYLVLGDVYANGYYVDIDPKKAEYYYNKAFEKGYVLAVYRIIDMYMNLNVDGIFNKKIISLYKKAIELNLKDAKIKLAKFYIQIGKYKKALEIVKTLPKENPKVRYLLYVLTGKSIYVQGTESNYGYLLLARAEAISKKAPRKALYYTFRAMLCNTSNSPEFALKLMKKINNAKVIRNIYLKAKKAPRCSNY
jgi:hypothetical protein